EQLNVPFSRLVLGGFSQGGGLATDLALHSPKPPGALAILSGAVVTLGAWRTLMSSRRGLKVFHSHGVQDPVLPFATAEMLRDAMVQAELDHSFVPFRGGHTIPAAVMERFGAFLRGLAAAA
ncbi:MAG TPA: hypothetical protein VFQ35_14015, partial [Polyangiaceae bacterium]|nr:hypothetical protein [Polyangiaceae bacterium]